METNQWTPAVTRGLPASLSAGESVTLRRDMNAGRPGPAYWVDGPVVTVPDGHVCRVRHGSPAQVGMVRIEPV